MSESSYFELFTRHADEPESYKAGEPVFVAGDRADCMYVVRSGTVSVHDGDLELEVVGPAGIFGEMALVDGGSRSASATAATDCELVPIDERRFEYLVQEVPNFAQTVMRVMALRLRAMNAAAAGRTSG